MYSFGTVCHNYECVIKNRSSNFMHQFTPIFDPVRHTTRALVESEDE